MLLDRITVNPEICDPLRRHATYIVSTFIAGATRPG